MSKWSSTHNDRWPENRRPPKRAPATKLARPPTPKPVPLPTPITNPKPSRMVFGEPDVDIKKQKDGQFTVTINGVDVYDPTTGAIRSHTTDDIACWFIDTDYNGETFIVRHAYFTGADEPYEKLQRALRAEIDESAWRALYTTTSLPFPKPAKGRLAVKVINHYGDEVLKVFKV